MRRVSAKLPSARQEAREQGEQEKPLVARVRVRAQFGIRIRDRVGVRAEVRVEVGTGPLAYRLLVFLPAGWRVQAQWSPAESSAVVEEGKMAVQCESFVRRAR